MADSEASPVSEKPPLRRLYRSRSQKLLAGVCGGLAEYFDLDVSIMRLLWILFTLLGGAGILAYIILWMVVPPHPDQIAGAPPRRSNSAVLGFALIILGLLLLAAWPGWCAAVIPMAVFSFAMPGFLLAVGLGLLLGWLLTRSRSSTTESPKRDASRLYRSRDHRMLAGICGGLGEYFNLDPTIVRILWVLFAVASLGIALLLYVILIVIIPEEPVA